MTINDKSKISYRYQEALDDEELDIVLIIEELNLRVKICSECQYT